MNDDKRRPVSAMDRVGAPRHLKKNNSTRDGNADSRTDRYVQNDRDTEIKSIEKERRKQEELRHKKAEAARRDAEKKRLYDEKIARENEKKRLYDEKIAAENQKKRLRSKKIADENEKKRLRDEKIADENEKKHLREKKGFKEKSDEKKRKDEKYSRGDRNLTPIMGHDENDYRSSEKARPFKDNFAFNDKDNYKNDKKSGKEADNSAQKDKPQPVLRLLKGSTKKHRRGMLVSITIILLLVTSLIIFQTLSPVNMIESTSIFFAGMGADGSWPVSLEESSDNRIGRLGTDIALVNDSSLFIYDNDGGLIRRQQHEYANPAVCTSTTRALVYDRGGASLRVENRSKTVLELAADKIPDITARLSDKPAIATADIAYNGSFAVALNSGGVFVCDSSGELKYVKPVTGKQIVSVSLSKGGEYLAIGTLGAENGDFVSDVIIMKTSETAPLCNLDFKGSVLVSLDYKGDRVMAVFDDMLSSIGEDGSKNDYSYNSAELSCLDNSNEKTTALLLTKHNDTGNNLLVVLDSNLTVIAQSEINFSATSISCTDDRIGLLNASKLVTYNITDKALKEIADLGLDPTEIVLSDDTAVMLTSGTIISQNITDK